MRPTKWGLYDRDALDAWVQGRICLLGDAAHPMLPHLVKARLQSFEDAAALASAFALHRHDVPTALLHYERVRHYRATRFQLGSKIAFDHLRAKDAAEQKALLEKLDKRVSPAFAHDKRGGEDNSCDLRVRRAQYRYRTALQEIGAVGLPPGRQGQLRQRLPANSGCRRLWLRVQAPSRAKRSPCTTAETTAGSSSREKCPTVAEWTAHHPGSAEIARMYAGKKATAEFDDYHSAEAVAHMANFCIGDLVELQPLRRDSPRCWPVMFRHSSKLVINRAAQAAAVG